MSPKKAAVAQGGTTLDAYSLKVVLRDSKPPIWRRVHVAARATLGHLHDVIQLAMGWENSHLHMFEIDGERFGTPSPDDFDPVRDERRVRLADVLPTVGRTFSYEYDFGDSWRHLITVEKALPGVQANTLPACVAGKRACPPEDSGGIWGLEDKLRARADPQDEDDEEIAEWLDDFDPEAFDLAAANQRLAFLRPKR